MYEINVICIIVIYGGLVRPRPLSVHNKRVSTPENLQIKQTRVPKERKKKVY